jgi:hypothetical protein
VSVGLDTIIFGVQISIELQLLSFVFGCMLLAGKNGEKKFILSLPYSIARVGQHCCRSV